MESDELLREALKILGKSEDTTANGVTSSTPGGAASEPGINTGTPSGAGASLQVEVAGAVGTSENKLDESLSRLTTGIEQLRITNEAQIREIDANTSAVNQNTSAQGSKGLSKAGSVLGDIFAPILRYSPLSPIISGIAGLFGGGEKEPAPLTPYTAPTPIHYQTYVGGSTTTSATTSTPAVSTKESVSTTPVQITVQTIDSRSFLDHSDAIASAVREALLRSHPLGDVLREG